MEGWIRRGWDMLGIDCFLIMRKERSLIASSGDLVVRARIAYGNMGETAVDLGEFVSTSLQTLKGKVSKAARDHGYFPRSDWLPFEEEFPSEGETW